MKTITEIRLGGLCATTLLAATVFLAACSSDSSRPMDREPGYGDNGKSVTNPRNVGSLIEDWGVEVIGIQTTATGYMLDFRYRVIDAEKAAPLLDRRIKPYIIVEKNNAKLQVPVTSKLGALRQTTWNVQENRKYFVLFSNPARHVQPGDKVTVVIGDFKAEHLTVI